MKIPRNILHYNGIAAPIRGNCRLKKKEMLSLGLCSPMYIYMTLIN